MEQRGRLIPLAWYPLALSSLVLLALVFVGGGVRTAWRAESLVAPHTGSPTTTTTTTVEHHLAATANDVPRVVVTSNYEQRRTPVPHVTQSGLLLDTSGIFVAPFTSVVLQLSNVTGYEVLAGTPGPETTCTISGTTVFVPAAGCALELTGADGSSYRIAPR